MALVPAPVQYFLNGRRIKHLTTKEQFNGNKLKKKRHNKKNVDMTYNNMNEIKTFVKQIFRRMALSQMMKRFIKEYKEKFQVECFGKPSVVSGIVEAPAAI